MVRPGAEWIARAIERQRTKEGNVRLPPSVSARRLLLLAQEVMGDDMKVFRSGEMLIWDVARHEGYNIPSYPMAGNGEFKEFLKDYGVSDVPGWYGRVGLGRETYDEFWRYACIMARNERYWRKVFAVPVSDIENADTLAEWLALVIAFCLGDDDEETDSCLFRC